VLRFLSIAIFAGFAFLLPCTSNATSLHTMLTISGRSSDHQLASSYTPDELQTAYDFSPLYQQGVDGTGQTVALIEIDRFGPSDLRTFDAANSLPDPTVSEVYVGGRQFGLRDTGEASMDLEWLHALAPGAALQVYYVNAQQSDPAVWRDMSSAVNQATAAGIKIISISLGSCGTGTGVSSVKAAMKAAMKRGVSVFVSSGDTGDRPGTVRDCGNTIGVAYPARDPSVVSVGGTSLHLTSLGLIANEMAWRKSGGGRAPGIARPAWQKAPSLPKDAVRWAPDVSFLGDPATGVSIYYNGRYHQAGGTSLGAPCWAAVWALVRENAENNGFTIPVAPKALYRVGNSDFYTSAFHDITTGSNGRYTAGVGWDPVTGWGTPDVTQLAQVVEGL
jgi:kumamolisin